MSEAEEPLILGAAAPCPSMCVHEAISRQAAITPDAIAIEHDERTVTYREMEERANQIASYLVAIGLQPGGRVLLCASASIPTLIALLAILKARGVYVPVDPSYPAARRDLIFSLASAELLLSDDETAHGAGGFRALRVDRLAADAAGFEGTAPPRRSNLDDLAYIIFTSGSTGTPKGVPIHHRGVANLVTAMADAWPIEPGSRVLQFASLGFDASVPEWACPLSRGGTVVLKPKAGLLLGDDLVRFIVERRISFVKLPASALRVTPQVELPALRTLVTAGEAVALDLVSFWSRGRRFFNCYGPTETSIGATMARLEAEAQEVTIGRPNPGMTAVVLNADLDPAPLGSVGELFIGGVGLSWGYLDDPASTAERFIPNPFGPPGSRLYRTRDLVRRLPSGDLQFVGRLDEQVKIRGNRVELGEIEATLRGHDDVAHALVRFADDMLIAYVVPSASSASAAPSSLRAFVERSLPSYMVPSHIIVLPEIPLSAHGKVDITLLPKPTGGSRDRACYRAPATSTERALAEIWEEVLDTEPVGAGDNFFELGGHSLAATRVVSRVNAIFGSSLQTQALFRNPTIQGLALELEAAIGSDAADRIGSI